MYIILTFIAKIIFRLISVFNLGSGKTWPGHLALKISPHILKDIGKKLPSHKIFITGTNGKTTTASLVAYLLRAQGYKVLYNETGANLLNGLVSTVLLNTSWKGKLNHDYLVFEVDEATLSPLLNEMAPDVLALLNLSRDQLDRHWETDLIFENWLSSLKKLDSKTSIILDGKSSKFKKIAELGFNKMSYFDDAEDKLKFTSLNGAFNAKNVNCAVLILEELGFKFSQYKRFLASFQPAYGRGELIISQGREYRVFLAKNPASLNQNLRMLEKSDFEYDSLLYILNDKIPDGHDVSWIYDVFPEELALISRGKKIFVTGDRCYDMSVRLQYAGVSIEDDKIFMKIRDTLKAIKGCEDCKKIIVFPNYSAMLEIRKLLTGRSIL